MRYVDVHVTYDGTGKKKIQVNGKDVYIKQPEFEELEFVSKLWGDEETMKDIGGTFNF